MKKLIVSAMFILLLTTQVSAQIVVIANNSVPESSIDKDKLVKMFSMDATVWSNGNAVVLVELGVDGDTKNKFYGFLGTSAKKMKNAWMKKML
ncbi:MAG: hypothetical protein GY863_05100, partial [bacterium]|nr:hypothetical protein [bacterium]